jgi:hypothetical protein
MPTLSLIEPAEWVCDCLPWEAVAILGAAVVVVILLGLDWPARK